MHDYLILNKGQRDGLRQNYAIDGRLIDPYLLFAQVIQAGGSIEVNPPSQTRQPSRLILMN